MDKLDCLFCKIIRGEIPAKKEFENEKVLVFHDITPQAPVHLLLIPKIHISNTNEINASNMDYIAEIFRLIPEMAKRMNIFEKGYRVVNNNGHSGGQTVNHIHFHLLGGRNLTWPPG
ncbi:MAG: histidine triad nucleotide-binding protein [Leptospira sp.]|jgi:histidine triad (HIT) family protein|nr:histidine triad nucleotide-binding protein [Leptospira sp.]